MQKKGEILNYLVSPVKIITKFSPVVNSEINSPHPLEAYQKEALVASDAILPRKGIG